MENNPDEDYELWKQYWAEQERNRVDGVVLNYSNRSDYELWQDYVFWEDYLVAHRASPEDYGDVSSLNSSSGGKSDYEIWQDFVFWNDEVEAPERNAAARAKAKEKMKESVEPNSGQD